LLLLHVHSPPCSKEWDAALQALARGMTRHPGLPELPWYAGWVCYQAGRYKEVGPGSANSSMRRPVRACVFDERS
jgi:hypothetical protein